MASPILCTELRERVRQFVLTDPGNNKALDKMIQYALITADKELRDVEPTVPLAWDVQSYDGFRTKAICDISAITAASPGVITCDSKDADVTGHGLLSGDVVSIDGISGMDQLNCRTFVAVRTGASTISLFSMDGVAVNTSTYDAYVSGGVIGHCGFNLTTYMTTIMAGAGSAWTLKRIMPNPTFDGHRSEVISEDESLSDDKWVLPGFATRPTRWRHWRNMTSANPSTGSVHYLFWYPPANQAYRLGFRYQKEIADLTFGATDYPFHPPEVHEMIWHGALAIMVGMIERARRETKERMYVRMEVEFAQQWTQKWAEDKMKLILMNRQALGQTGGTRKIRI